MQLVITAIAVIAGLLLSFTIALVVEEFIFGKVLPLFFAPVVAVPVKVTKEQLSH